ncbi:MAG TPA: hypothetical protein VFB04_07935 [Terriglobales bacterium]|nr:hypothetical protein [Terriglobales bacterium]
MNSNSTAQANWEIKFAVRELSIEQLAGNAAVVVMAVLLTIKCGMVRVAIILQFHLSLGHVVALSSSLAAKSITRWQQYSLILDDGVMS